MKLCYLFPFLLFLDVLVSIGYGRDRLLEGEEALEQAILQLLEEEDVVPFLKATTPTVADFKAEAARHGNDFEILMETVRKSDDEFPEIGEMAPYIEASAVTFLKAGNDLGILSAEADWAVVRVTALDLGNRIDYRVHKNLTGFQARESQEAASEIRVVLERATEGPDPQNLNGEYVLSLDAAKEFPGGWRLRDGIRWVLFPEGVGGPRLQESMTAAARIAAGENSLSSTNDPALHALGEQLAAFLRANDPAYFVDHVVPSLTALTDFFPQEEGPPREEIEFAQASINEAALASAKDVLEKAQAIDFASIDVKEVIAERVTVERTPNGLPRGLDAAAVHIAFTIPELHVNGETLINAELALAAGGALRLGGRWFITDIDIHWEKIPDTLLSNKARKEVEFENYVAKHGTLPLGTLVPDVEFTRIEDAAKVKLSNLGDKIIVIEWWARWCGPCQDPMRKMQDIRTEHPEWSDRVAIITVSIDDDLETAREHLKQKGWMNLPNYWAGRSWSSEPAKAFRISGIPCIYVLTPDLTVAYAGHPQSHQWKQQVDALLKTE